MKKKGIALASALILGITAAVGGALAWLSDETEPVENTFSPSTINIALEGTKKDFQMVPGCTIAKDPTVTVLNGSEACYLFVKLDKSENFDAFLEYRIAVGWTALDGVTDVYYRQVETDGIGTGYSVLQNNQVTVKGTVTKESMDSLTPNNYPTLTVTAYASQLYRNNTETFTPGEAWENAQPTAP